VAWGCSTQSQAKHMFGAVTKFFRLQPAAKNEKKFVFIESVSMTKCPKYHFLIITGVSLAKQF